MRHPRISQALEKAALLILRAEAQRGQRRRMADEIGCSYQSLVAALTGYVHLSPAMLTYARELAKVRTAQDVQTSARGAA